MSNRIRRSLLCLALCFVVSACGDDGAATDDAGPGPVDASTRDGATPTDAGTPIDAGEGEDAGADEDAGSDVDASTSDAGPIDASFPDSGLGVISVTGTIRELGALGAGDPQANVEVCVEGRGDIACRISNASGTFTSSDIPAGTEMLLSFVKTGFVPALATVTTGTTDVTFNYFIVTPATINLLGSVVMVPGGIDPNDGHLFVQLGEGEASSGATVSISAVGAAGPYYTTASGLPDRTLTSTTTSGTALFANVPPGDHIVTITPGPGRTCTPTGFAWPGTVAGTVRVTTRAAHVTSTNSECL